jgi:hypothetical protein
VRVGRGFVLSGNDASTQIDILLTDRNLPVIFQDGDLVMASSASVLGIVEVKTRITRSDLPDVLKKLATNASIINRASNRVEQRFVGLFAYDSEVNDPEYVVRQVKDAVAGDSRRVISFVCLGKSDIVKYYMNLRGETECECHIWVYVQAKGLGPAFFLADAIDHFTPLQYCCNKEEFFPLDTSVFKPIAKAKLDI